MSWRRYSLIILLGKPLSIALYSFSLTSIFNWLAMLQLELAK